MKKLTYKTLASSFQYEIPKIKGSKFIATLIPISSKETLEEKLTKVQKHYFDATHNCYAWKLGAIAQKNLFGEWSVRTQQERANDDGEPSNTAGKPILAILNGYEVFDILAVVTRYFGGTLLGVGGLIQAYTESTKEAMTRAPIIEKEIKKSLKIQYTYEQLSFAQYIFGKYDMKVISEKYSDIIIQEIEGNIAFLELVEKELVEKQIHILE